MKDSYSDTVQGIINNNNVIIVFSYTPFLWCIYKNISETEFCHHKLSKLLDTLSDDDVFVATSYMKCSDYSGLTIADLMPKRVKSARKIDFFAK